MSDLPDDPPLEFDPEELEEPEGGANLDDYLDFDLPFRVDRPRRPDIMNEYIRIISEIITDHPDIMNIDGRTEM